MKFEKLLILTGIISILIGRVCLHAQDISFTNLPSLDEMDFRVDPYLKVAVQLQAMGQQAATDQLLKLAKNAPAADVEERTAILCRMLFANKPGSNFERPGFLGAPSFLGNETLSEHSITNWPSEPIEIVDGIPFAIVWGYGYEGIKYPNKNAESYVRYCSTNCVWSSYHFSLKSKSDKAEAAKKLIASKKWREPLEPLWEQRYLLEQIQ